MNNMTVKDYHPTPVTIDALPLSPNERNLDKPSIIKQRKEIQSFRSELYDYQPSLTEKIKPTSTSSLHLTSTSSPSETNVFSLIDEVLEEYDILCYKFENILDEKNMSQEDWEKEQILIQEMENESQNEKLNR